MFHHVLPIYFGSKDRRLRSGTKKQYRRGFMHSCECWLFWFCILFYTHSSTRSSSVVTLARPPSSSSLPVTDRSFRYASPCLWNQLHLSPRKPHSGTSSSISCSPIPSPVTSSCSDSPLCTSITTSLFHSRLKTYLFHKSYPPYFHFFLPDCLHGLLPAPFLLSYSFFLF